MPWTGHTYFSPKITIVYFVLFFLLGTLFMNSHNGFTVPKLQNILDSGRLLCYSENFCVCFKNIITYFHA